MLIADILFPGFDLVGWEDGLHPLSFYLVDLLWFKERLVEEGLDIPFAFHAGETLSDGGKADMVPQTSSPQVRMRTLTFTLGQNLYDAVLLDTKRIGHGFSLPQHPLLMEICKERKIGQFCSLRLVEANVLTHRSPSRRMLPDLK